MMLGAADYERAKSWATAIVESLLPAARYRDEGSERRYLSHGGLLVSKKSGAWYSYSAGRGSYSAIALIELLRQCCTDEAVIWVRAWLDAHPGVGSCNGDPTDDGDTPASAALAREYLDSLGDVIGTPSETYLKSRRLDPPYPATGHIPYARSGEAGFAGILTSHDRIVGLQVLYITPTGEKSTVQPQRRRFMLEKAPDAVFAMPHSGASTDVCICEGLEDTLSIYRYGKRRCRVIGLPGIGTLRNLKFPKGTKVTIVKDGDALGSAADKALQDGVDCLILDGVDVCVTPTPLSLDANKILQEQGVDALVALLDSAEPAVLSLHGEIERLAKLEPLDYAQERVAAIDRLKQRGIKGITLGVLDAEVRKARDRLIRKTRADKPDDAFSLEDTPQWPNPVDGAELLDALAKAIGGYVVMSKVQCHAVALWVVFTHCFTAANNAPKLWIKSAERRSGKTRLLQVLSHLASRPLAVSYISAAMLPRVVTQLAPSLLLDEVDTFVNGSEELRGVLNSGFDRDSFVIIGVKVGDDWVPTKFNAWCPQALAGIGELPDTVADRSLCVDLARKSRNEKVRRLRRRDSGPLEELAQKCARWAADNVDELADAAPEIPAGLNDRAADAWELCIAIADRCSDEWGRKARLAALEISGDGAVVSSFGEMLLSDIRDVFEAMHPIPEIAQKISSYDLVRKLTDLIHRPWPEFRKGLPLSQTTLASLLRPFHISPGQVWLDGEKTRGYTRTAFKDAFDRYLPPLAALRKISYHPDTPEQSGRPVGPEDGCGFQAEIEVVGEAGPTTLKTPDHPNETGNPTGLPPSNGEDREEEKENFAVQIDEPQFSSLLPNLPRPKGGTDPASGKPRSEVEQKIIQLWHDHPDWSFRKIGRECSVTHTKVQRVVAAVIRMAERQ
jgi:hypothetical protein